MPFNPFIRSFPIVSPYSEAPLKFDNFWTRIDKILKMQSVNIILIDGRTQTGKSTFAEHIARHYDKDYKIFFTVKDLVNYFKNFEYNRWIILEEPQLEANRMRFWDERNMVMAMFVSAFGFTKNNLIMTLPALKGIADILLTNISLRITIVNHLNFKDEVVREAYIKKPVFNAKRDKWIWVTTEQHNIPTLPIDAGYLEKKKINFDEKLTEWNNRLENNSFDYNKILSKIDDTGSILHKFGLS